MFQSPPPMQYLLDSHVPSREGTDAWWWRLTRSGVFDIRSLYTTLRGSHEVKFPWKIIWGVKAPRRVAYFVWSAAWGKILTCDNLMRRGYALVGWCCMCQCNGETMDHLLLHCPRAAVLWSYVFRSDWIQLVLPGLVVDLSEMSFSIKTSSLCIKKKKIGPFMLITVAHLLGGLATLMAWAGHLNH